MTKNYLVQSVNIAENETLLYMELMKSLKEQGQQVTFHPRSGEESHWSL